MGRIKALVAALAVALAVAVVAPSAPAGAAVNPTPSFDPSNRSQVWNAYLTSLAEARTVPTGWTGNTSTCTQGTESAASQQATLAAINFYRALNKLPLVTLDSAMNTEALGAAFLMQANGSLNHFPPDTWSCWSQARDDAAGASNLSQGAVGAGSIDIYMADPGAGNEVAGHRRYVLNPRATKLGVGSTSGFSALRTGAQYWGGRPSGVDWVAWPSAGFVPKPALRPFSWLDGDLLFSISSNAQPNADYTNASVVVKVGSTTLPTVIESRAANFADKTLTWSVTPPASFDSSAADMRFDITVSGVRTAGGASIDAHSYSSTVISSAGAAATVPGAPGNVSATAGNGQATVSWTAPGNGGSAITGYKVTPYKAGVAQPVQTFGASPLSRTITGLTNGSAYTFRVQAVNGVGTGALSAASNSVTPNPPAATEWAPFDSYGDLVTQVFQRMVGRAPTGSELSSWTSRLQGAETPGDLVASLRTSSRHTTVVDPVARLYWAFFGRIPDRSGLEYWIGQRQGGRSLLSIADFFSRSNEFVQQYGPLSNAQFVNQVYVNVLGRPADADGTAYWSGELDAGRRSRGSVMLGFSESSEYRNAMAKKVTVAVLYIQLLRRSPTAGELASGVTAITNTSVAAFARNLLRNAPPD